MNESDGLCKLCECDTGDECMFYVIVGQLKSFWKIKYEKKIL